MQTIRRFEIIQALAAHRRIGRAARTLSPPASAFMDIVRTIERDLDASEDGGAIPRDRRPRRSASRKTHEPITALVLDGLGQIPYFPPRGIAGY